MTSWGDAAYGGDSTQVQAQLRNVSCIQATDIAFCALLRNGSVVTWGDAERGGNSGPVQSQLRQNVVSIASNVASFAALLNNGSVVTWGEPYSGGDSRHVQHRLTNVRAIHGRNVLLQLSLKVEPL